MEDQTPMIESESEKRNADLAEKLINEAVKRAPKLNDEQARRLKAILGLESGQEL